MFTGDQTKQASNTIHAVAHRQRLATFNWSTPKTRRTPHQCSVPAATTAPSPHLKCRVAAAAPPPPPKRSAPAATGARRKFERRSALAAPAFQSPYYLLINRRKRILVRPQIHIPVSRRRALKKTIRKAGRANASEHTFPLTQGISAPRSTFPSFPNHILLPVRSLQMRPSVHQLATARGICFCFVLL